MMKPWIVEYIHGVDTEMIAINTKNKSILRKIKHHSKLNLSTWAFDTKFWHKSQFKI